MKETIEQKITGAVNDIEIMSDVGFKDSAVSATLILAISIAHVLFMNSYEKTWYFISVIITAVLAVITIYLMIGIASAIIKAFFTINHLKYANDLIAMQNIEKKLSSIVDALGTDLNRHSVMLFAIAAWGLFNSLYILLYNLVHIKK